MKHTFIILASFILACSTASEAGAVTREKDKQTEKDKGAQDNTGKSVYDKLFKDKGKHSVSRGLMTVHRYEDKLYLELPLSLMGREFLINPVITSSSDLKLPFGVPAAMPRRLVVEKTDSLVLFTMPGDYVRTNGQDENHGKAFGLSQTNAVSRAFPVEGYTGDSLSLVFDATSYFTGANPDMLDMKGRNYDGLISIKDGSLQDRVSYIEDIRAYENCISITQAGTLQLTLAVIGIEFPEKPEVSISLQIVMALLPTEKMKPREADPHIGSGYVTYTDYRDVNHVKKGHFATRRNITPQKTVVFHVDTLLKPGWREAIHRSAEGWNRVFEKMGFGNPIVLRPYGADSAFAADNPLVNTIALLDYDRYDITSYNITDPRTGEILSTKTGIPRDFAFLVRRKGVYQMAGVDERFRTYYIPDDLVCEGLTAYMLKIFGRSLGLVPNFAGSFAYSPGQLRSPAFTQENGITASVMDDVLYNYLARPGDKEKGVALVIFKPGVCDEFALQYLYAPTAGNEGDTLKQWAMRHKGDPRYSYAGKRTAVPYDPRCQQDDLGNDPFAAVDARIEHLKYIVSNSPQWFDQDGDNVPQDYREMFPNLMYSEFNRSLFTLFQYIGGVYISIPGENSTVPVYQPVPAELQRKAVQKITGICEDLSWMDSRAFLSLGGANSSMSGWASTLMGVPVNRLMSWLTRMGTAVEKSKEGDPYTQRDYLDDIEKYVFAEVLAGKPLSQNKMAVAKKYMDGLIVASPALGSIQKTVLSSGVKAVSLPDDLFMPDSLPFSDYGTDISTCKENEPLQNTGFGATIKFSGGTGIEALCYEKLANARRLLQQAKRLDPDEISRGKCEYLIMVAGRVLL